MTLPSRITLQPSEVPSSLLRAFPGYSGRKCAIHPAESISLQGTYWSGGSRSSYALARLDGAGEVGHAPVDSPFDRLGVEGTTWPIPRGWVVVEHVIFCGKDLGLRFHVNPADLAPLLPPSGAELSAEERAVLRVYWGTKGGYREEVLSKLRKREDGKISDYFSKGERLDWRSIREALLARGFLSKSKAGAISLSKEGRRALELAGGDS